MIDPKMMDRKKKGNMLFLQSAIVILFLGLSMLVVNGVGIVTASLGSATTVLGSQKSGNVYVHQSKSPDSICGGIINNLEMTPLGTCAPSHMNSAAL